MTAPTTPARRTLPGPTPLQATVVLVLMVYLVVWHGAWITFYVLRPIVMFLDSTRHDLFGATGGALPW